jgi:hypothetical protein
MTLAGALELLAERRIAEAIASGAFDRLPGHGHPLKLDDDSALAGEWRLAFQLLRDNGFAPAWIESGAEIRRNLAQARAELRTVGRSDAGRTAAEARFAACAAELNRRIARHNLTAPAARWHIPVIDAVRDQHRLHPDAPPGEEELRPPTDCA